MRLTVVWLIGALALAAGWRWYTVHDAERAAVRTAAAIPPTPTFVDDAHHAIVRALRDTYPEHVPLDGMSAVAYLGDPLVELPDPGLRRFLPDTHVFMTRAVDGCFADDVLASFRRTEDGRDDVRLWIAGAYDGHARRFVSQFLGADAPTLADRSALRRTLAELVEVLRTGHVPLHRGAPHCLGAERAPSHDDPVNRLAIDLSVDANGRVDRIAISHATDHFAFEVSSK